MARIIYFGEDSCHRLMVLAGAGYSVVRCGTIKDVQFHLESSDRLDAVVISDEWVKTSRLASHLANADLPQPVILFAGTDEPCDKLTFDLVIPPLTAPSDWLSTIESTIARFQAQGSLSSRVAGQVALL